MPGGYSRSKGCLTCRQRRVKCDQGRPKCERCQKGYFVCGGYSREWVFRNEHVQKRSPGRYADKAEPKPSFRNSSCLSNSADSPFSVAITADSPCQAVSLPPALSLHGFTENIVFSHFQHNVLLEYPETPSGELEGVNPWFSYLRQVFTGDRVSGAYFSILAVAVGFFARVHKDPSLQEIGDRIYGHALRRIMEHIKDASIVDSCSVSTGPLCLSIYELVRASSSLGWAQHSSGTAALTEMMGPYAFQDKVANAMFHLSRGLIIMSCIFHRKRCFLEQPKWKTIPFELDQEPRQLSSRAQDILCDIPGFLEDVRTIKALRTSRKSNNAISAERHAAVLSSKVIAAIEQLCELRWEWEDEFPASCYEVATRPGSTLCVDDYGEPLFPTVLIFWRMDRAMEILNFDAMFLILYSILSLTGTDTACVRTERRTRPCSSILTPLQPKPSFTANPLINPGQGDRLDGLALEICRLVDYCLQSKYAGLGAITLLFPLRVAYKTLQHDRRVASWLERMSRDIAESRGFEIGTHILSQKQELTLGPTGVV